MKIKAKILPKSVQNSQVGLVLTDLKTFIGLIAPFLPVIMDD